MDLRERIRQALDEDIGPGDLTTDACIDPTKNGSAVIVAKQAVVVSGMHAARVAFETAAARRGVFVALTVKVADGQLAQKGDVIAQITGNLSAILEGERVALNLLMRMTGIATHVDRVLTQVGETTFRAVDTRKTTPLWRDLEKAAVKHGGGDNHRFGLFDGVLIKDNHIAAVGGVTAAVERARAQVHHLVRIEVEVGSLTELEEALNAGADGVLLDNMDDAHIAQAIAFSRERWPNAFLEASGNMDTARLISLAQVGLDVVSVGGFIHHAVWADLSLKVLS